jgi:outer membrane protein assembly factor BamB
VSRSRDYSTVGLVIGDDSRGAFDVYTAATGKVVSGSLNDEIASSSVNGDGSTMLVSGNGATYVIDAATGSLLGSIGCARGLSVLNASGSTGYCVVAQSVVTLNVKRFLTGQVINLPQQATSGALPALSPNGRVLVVPSNGGATIVEV